MLLVWLVIQWALGKKIFKFCCLLTFFPPFSTIIKRFILVTVSESKYPRAFSLTPTILSPEKLPAVTHVPTFQIARQMTSWLRVITGPVSVKKAIVYYFSPNSNLQTGLRHVLFLSVFHSFFISFFLSLRFLSFIHPFFLFLISNYLFVTFFLPSLFFTKQCLHPHLSGLNDHGNNCKCPSNRTKREKKKRERWTVKS